VTAFDILSALMLSTCGAEVCHDSKTDPLDAPLVPRIACLMTSKVSNCKPLIFLYFLFGRAHEFKHFTTNDYT